MTCLSLGHIFGFVQTTPNKKMSNENSAQKGFQGTKLIPPNTLNTWSTVLLLNFTANGSVQIMGRDQGEMSN